MNEWADLYDGRINAEGEIISPFRPPVFTTNDDRSTHEMSSINATVTKHAVINLVLLPGIDSR